MQYCKDRGVDVIGLTLSEEQAIKVKSKGLNVIVGDYRILNTSFIKNFDRITALGSSEHVCSSLGSLLPGVSDKNCNKIRSTTWNMFYNYLKPNGKFYVTVLTRNLNRDLSLYDWLQFYILERHYGGYYSTMEDIDRVITTTQFMKINVQDKTKDYYWSSIADENHFGNWYIKWHEDSFNKILYIIKGLCTDPFLIHHWAYYFMDTWMWQFNGCEKRPLTDEQVKTSYVLLKYFILVK
jgi:cyclopropane fatty-acyl-phospholipid synthase-like methyltransferase